MNDDARRQAELLDAYWCALDRDPSVASPGELDPETAALTRRLRQEIRPADPEAAFAEQLRARLEAQAAATQQRAIRIPIAGRQGLGVRGERPRRWWSLAGLAASILVILALADLGNWSGRSQPVSAQEIVERARVVAVDFAANGVQSFHRTSVSTAWFYHNGVAVEPTTTTTTIWFVAPNRWRRESQAPLPDGRIMVNGSVSDGTTLWTYEGEGRNLQVRVADLPAGPPRVTDTGFSQPPVGDLGQLLELARQCYQPQLAGSATIAARPVYVIDFGPTTCPSARVPHETGRLIGWFDTQTFFVHKTEQYAPDGTLVYRSEVTGVEYNIPIDSALFTYTPPPGAPVHDLRARPETSQDQVQPSTR